MSHFWRVAGFVALATLILAGCATGTRKAASFAAALKARPEVTIVVTDSGLGGLSVVADLAARLPQSGIARSARVVFVNALLDDAVGYNDLKDEADRIRVFDAALAAMESRYRPDLVLVACNTLSVFYGKTEHARRGTTETVSIVPMGADLIERTLKETPDATAMIFATKGTIDSGAHRRLLVGKGVPDARIVGQACPKLTGAIERGAHSEETAGRIRGLRRGGARAAPGEEGPAGREPQLHPLRLRPAALGRDLREARLPGREGPRPEPAHDGSRPRRRAAPLPGDAGDGRGRFEDADSVRREVRARGAPPDDLARNRGRSRDVHARPGPLPRRDRAVGARALRSRPGLVRPVPGVLDGRECKRA
ncbi:MAG: aspartate/glutamate racemase family protein [Holophagales bacterium]|nr:aspartate/glutamate racemase family protein [Holophagales bacterium]